MYHPLLHTGDVLNSDVISWVFLREEMALLKMREIGTGAFGAMDNGVPVEDIIA